MDLLSLWRNVTHTQPAVPPSLYTWRAPVLASKKRTQLKLQGRKASCCPWHKTSCAPGPCITSLSLMASSSRATGAPAAPVLDPLPLLPCLSTTRANINLCHGSTGWARTVHRIAHVNVSPHPVCSLALLKLEL
jgi:hypothetical protein